MNDGVVDKEGMRIRGSCNLVADLFKDKENGAKRIYHFLEPLVPWMREQLHIPSVIPLFNYILHIKRDDKHTLLYSILALALNEFPGLMDYMCNKENVGAEFVIPKSCHMAFRDSLEVVTQRFIDTGDFAEYAFSTYYIACTGIHWVSQAQIFIPPFIVIEKEEDVKRDCVSHE